MPFLFRTSTRFIIVDEKPRQGVFYQIYDKEGFLRPALIHPSSALTYSATLDHHDNLHVVVQNTNHQTAYYHSFETSPTKRTVLEDTKNMYQFENMSIQILGETPHLFYTVIHPNGNGRSLVHQSLNAASPMATHLITNLPLNCQLSYYVVEDTLYILYPLYEEGYTLNCLTFTENAYDSRTLVRSDIPISDWNMCLHGQKLYVLFTTDTYGHPAFHLLDTLTLKDLALPLPVTATSPSLLSYLDCLWIHYKDGDKLYTLFGLPEQEMFSIPVISSLQLPATLYDYYSLDHKSFNASKVFANLMSTLRLATLSSIDIKEIHPDLSPNLELSLLLEGLSLVSRSPVPSRTSTPIATPMPTPPPLSTIPPIPTAPTPPMPMPSSSPLSPTPPTAVPTVRSVAQAAKDFMQEGNFFEP